MRAKKFISLALFLSISFIFFSCEEGQIFDLGPEWSDLAKVVSPKIGGIGTLVKLRFEGQGEEPNLQLVEPSNALLFPGGIKATNWREWSVRATSGVNTKGYGDVELAIRTTVPWEDCVKHIFRGKDLPDNWQFKVTKWKTNRDYKKIVLVNPDVNTGSILRGELIKLVLGTDDKNVATGRPEVEHENTSEVTRFMFQLTQFINIASSEYQIFEQEVKIKVGPEGTSRVSINFSIPTNGNLLAAERGDFFLYGPIVFSPTEPPLVSGTINIQNWGIEWVPKNPLAAPSLKKPPRGKKQVVETIQVLNSIPELSVLKQRAEGELLFADIRMTNGQLMSITLPAKIEMPAPADNPPENSGKQTTTWGKIKQN